MWPGRAVPTLKDGWLPPRGAGAEGVVQVSSSTDRAVGHESAALDEIELAGELMIAATASSGDRLPTARIDEVLLLQAPPADPDHPPRPAAHPDARTPETNGGT